MYESKTSISICKMSTILIANKNFTIISYFYCRIHTKSVKIMSRARKIVTKFHNYSYEIVMSPVIVNSYKNVHNSYQIVK